LRGLIVLLDLLPLCLDIQLVLKVRSVRSQVGRASCAEIDANIETAVTDCRGAFGAEVEMVFDLGPGLLERIGLFVVPSATINLLTCFSSSSPHASQQPDANIGNVAHGGDCRADRRGFDLPVTALAGETEGEIAL
jgi:hypothetical protein